MNRGRAATAKKYNAPSKHPKKEKMRPLQKIVNVSQPWVDSHLVDINIPQSSTQARYINENVAHQKTLMILYWEILRHQMGHKRFPSTILVPEKCMIIVLQLSTHDSQPSLLKMSLPIQILRPWQSAKGVKTGINGRKQLRLS
jgi:hypothetical protein